MVVQLLLLLLILHLLRRPPRAGIVLSSSFSGFFLQFLLSDLPFWEGAVLLALSTIWLFGVTSFLCHYFAHTTSIMILFLAGLGQQYTTNKQQFGDFFPWRSITSFQSPVLQSFLLEYDTIPIIIIDSDYSWLALFDLTVYVFPLSNMSILQVWEGVILRYLSR